MKLRHLEEAALYICSAAVALTLILILWSCQTQVKDSNIMNSNQILKRLLSHFDGAGEWKYREGVSIR